MFDDQKPPETQPTGPTMDVQNEAQNAVQRLHPSVQRPEADAVFTDDMRLRFDVEGSASYIEITPKDEMILGRKDPASGDAPDVDLNTYAAYQMGVSRAHAKIVYQNQRLILYDLGSRNGTYYQGERMTPDQPKTLYNRDEIRLGKIALRLTFVRK